MVSGLKVVYKTFEDCSCIGSAMTTGAAMDRKIPQGRPSKCWQALLNEDSYYHLRLPPTLEI